MQKLGYHLNSMIDAYHLKIYKLDSTEDLFFGGRREITASLLLMMWYILETTNIFANRFKLNSYLCFQSDKVLTFHCFLFVTDRNNISHCFFVSFSLVLNYSLLLIM